MLNNEIVMYQRINLLMLLRRKTPKPELLGIGLDESTAILAEGDAFEVIEKTYVPVYDGKFWRRDGNPVVPEGDSFYLLKKR